MRHPARPRAVAILAVLGSVAVGIAGARAATLDDATYVSQSVPSTFFCGQTGSVTITLRNTGTSTWLRNTYSLRSQNPAGTTRWGVTSVPPAVNVGGGSPATFSFTVTAPTTPGTYAFQWQMHNGVGYFGALTPTVSIPVVCDVNGYKTGYREVTGTALADLFAGGRHIVEDPSFSSPLVNHVETSTVYWGGRYLMYHRTPPTNGTISLATSLDGNTWTAYNNGAAVLADLNPRNSVSAPNVIVDRDSAGRPRLTMVVEHCLDCVQPPGDPNPPNPSPTRVASSYSYNGTSWTQPVDIVVPTPGTYDEHDAGTPNVVRTPDGRYRVGYHAYGGSDPFNNAISIGFANGASVDTPLAKTGPVIGNTRATKPGWWASAGAGARDIVKEGSYWYMVFEGLRGYVLCDINSEISSWGIARTLDSTFQSGWELSSLNPIRIDRQGRGCGEDMPRFQVVNGVPYIVVTAMLQIGVTPPYEPQNQPVKRYRIDAGARGRIGVDFVGMARTADGGGYYEVTSAGHVYAYGNATYHGNAPATNVVGIAAKPTGGGYWVVTSNGVVHNLGSAGHFGDARSLALNKPVVGIAATPSGNGYWLVAGDGGIFNYGDAPLLGSMGGKFLAAPVVGMAATTTGQGYWLVASDGGIFNYGDAPFYGSMGGQFLASPIVGMAGGPNNGYWLLGKDGGIFSFPSSQPFAGSTGSRLAELPNGTAANAVGIVSTPGTMGYGYWILFRDGGVLDLGPAGYHGDISFG